MILAQYYNLIRLGRVGYTRILTTMRENARYLAKGIATLDKFDILNGGELTPSVVVKLRDESKYNAADLVAVLAQHGWIIPAFTLPPAAQHINVMRMNIKEQFSRDMADILLLDLRNALLKLDAIHSKPHAIVARHHR